MRIDQFISIFYPKAFEGAVFNDVIGVRQGLQKLGYPSDVFSIDPEKDSGAKFFSKYKDSDKNILIYHYGEGSLLTDFILKLKAKKILRYHGVTPPKFLVENPKSLLDTIGGNAEARILAPAVDMAFATSDYTRIELETLGFKNINILPIFIEFDKYDKPISEDLLVKKTNSKYKNLIFVGRIVPNKKQEDVIKTFYLYKKINPYSRLFLIGETKSCPAYVAFLKNLVAKLGLSLGNKDTSVEKDVYLTGSINFDELLGFYRSSDIFVCMSEHEGFCVPLLEAMHFKLPVIAYNSTAMPFTLGDAGILINRKKYSEAAGLIDMIFTDKQLHSQIIKKQDERLQDFAIEKTSAKLERYIEIIKSTPAE